jgi:hypothetical protein
MHDKPQKLDLDPVSDATLIKELLAYMKPPRGATTATQAPPGSPLPLSASGGDGKTREGLPSQLTCPPAEGLRVLPKARASRLR